MERNLLKRFTAYVSQSVIGMLGLSLYILADTYFIALAVGPKGLASLNFSIPLFAIQNSIGLMIGIGAATYYTILRQQDQKRSKTVYTQAINLALIFGLLFMLAGLFASSNIAAILGAKGEILELSASYIAILLSFCPLFMLNNVILAFVRNDARPGLAMLAMLMSSLFNIVFDYILMFPFQLGMQGAAMATVAAPLVSILIMQSHFWQKKSSFGYLWTRLKLKVIRQIISLGFSTCIAELSSAITLISFNLVIVLNAGNLAVAAYGVIANYALIVIAVFTGVSQGLQPLASEAYGQKDYPVIKKLIRYALITVVLIASTIYLISFLLTKELVAFFNSSGQAELQAMAERGLRLYFLGFFFVGINIITAAFLSAINKIKKASFISLLRSSILIIPALFILSQFLGLDGVWLSFVVSEFLLCFLSLYYIRCNSRSLN